MRSFTKSNLVNEAVPLAVNDVEEPDMNNQLINFPTPVQIQLRPLRHQILPLLTANLITDSFFTHLSLGTQEGEPTICNNSTKESLISGEILFKLIKFSFITTAIFIPLTHFLVRSWNWESDKEYSLNDFVLYDFQSVVTDLFFFFFTSRLYNKPGVDRVFPNLLPMAAGCVIPSLTTNITWMQHSFSMFDIMCGWPWQLFAFSILALAGVVAIIHHHIVIFRKFGVLGSRLAENISVISIFILPYITNPNFHFHHWYACWLFGMCANAPTILSQIVMSYMWGCYINGIAVYGRDPILSCSHAFYTSTNLQCSFMSSYSNQTDDDQASTPQYPEFESPNWRNCSAHYS